MSAHLVGELGDLLEVVLRAGRDPPEEDLLGHAPAERHADAVLELLGGEEEALLGQVLRVAEGADAARDDRDLEQRIRPLQRSAMHQERRRTLKNQPMTA